MTHTHELIFITLCAGWNIAAVVMLRIWFTGRRENRRKHSLARLIVVNRLLT